MFVYTLLYKIYSGILQSTTYSLLHFLREFSGRDGITRHRTPDSKNNKNIFIYLLLCTFNSWFFFDFKALIWNSLAFYLMHFLLNCKYCYIHQRSKTGATKRRQESNGSFCCQFFDCANTWYFLKQIFAAQLIGVEKTTTKSVIMHLPYIYHFALQLLHSYKIIK